MKLKLPFDVSDGKQFYYTEKLNDIRLNVYIYEESDKSIYSTYISSQHERTDLKDVDILVIGDAKNPDLQHYVYIKKLKALLYDQKKTRIKLIIAVNAFKDLQLHMYWKNIKRIASAAHSAALECLSLVAPLTLIKFNTRSV